MERQPQAIPATKFDFGPGAMEVGFKRKALEGDQAKLDLGKKKLADDQYARMKYEPEVVFRAHGNAMAEMDRAYIATVGQMISNHEAGNAGNPYEPGTPENMALIEIQSKNKQFAAGSLQSMDEYQTALKEINTNPGKYRPEAIEAFKKAYEDPRIATGEIDTPVLEDYYDFNKAYNDVLARMPPDVTSKAIPLASGKNLNERLEFLSDEDILAVATSFAQQEDANRALLSRYELMADQDPQKAQELGQRAADAGRGIYTQMAYEDLRPSGYTKNERKISGSERSAGAENERNNASWLVETTAGIANGTLENMRQVEGPEDMSFFSGYTPDHDYSVTDVMNFDFGKRVVNGKDTPVRIVQTLRDNKTGNIRMALEVVGDDGKATDVIQTEWYNPDQYANVVIPRIAENNREFSVSAANKYIKEHKTYGIDAKTGYRLRPERSGTAEDIFNNAPKTAEDIFE